MTIIPSRYQNKYDNTNCLHFAETITPRHVTKSKSNKKIIDSNLKTRQTLIDRSVFRDTFVRKQTKVGPTDMTTLCRWCGISI